MRRAVILVLSLCILLFVVPVGAAEDEIWTDARAFYLAYGNEAVFHPVSETDGMICCGTKAVLTEDDVRYRTIGWKMTFRSASGEVLQTLYFRLGGEYLIRKDIKNTGIYNYQLFELSLTDIRKRLNDSALKCLQTGSCAMQLDACLTVNEGGMDCGSIEDDGTMSGEVYTDYYGIVSAREWSIKGKESLKNYFGKNVSGLFCQVLLHGSEGIAEILGSGSYLYGTSVEIKAIPMEHYRFMEWTGNRTEKSASFSIILDENIELTARASYIDQPPVISAEDLYFSGSDREEGQITPEGISGYFTADDPEDGQITFGTRKNNYLKIQMEDYDSEKGEIPVLLTARDSAGNEVQKKVFIHIIDTEPERTEKRDGRIRFVSSVFYRSASGTFVPEKEGGLMEGSVWICIKEYRSLLESVLEE